MLDIVKLREAAERAMGARFEFRGRAPATGFDCLGLVRWLYEQAGHPLHEIDEPEEYPEDWWRMRPALFLDGIRQQATIFPTVISLLPGDLVLFAIGSPIVTHLGVVLRGDEFVHCFLGRGVAKARASQAFWRNQCCGVARVLAAQPQRVV